MNTYNFLQTMLDMGVKNGVFHSVVTAVGIHDKLLYRCAAGAANLDTLFDMASMSKIMGPTMLALRALEEGDLTLDDSVSRFFDAPEDKADITIFQLMTHTAGFSPTYWLFSETDSPDDVVSCIMRHPLEATPDGAPRYSCIGYILLGKILERVYDAPLDRLAKERVFTPLGMTNTGYNPTRKENIAPTEVDSTTNTAWCGVVHDENARFLRGVSGNAGVFSDIHDCVRYASMLACGGNGYLAPATLRKAIRNYTPGHDVHRGLGFHLGGTPLCFMGDLFPEDSFGHTGFTGTSLVIDPSSGLYVLLLSNRVHPTRQNEKLFRFRRQYHNRIYTAFSKHPQNG